LRAARPKPIIADTSSGAWGHSRVDAGTAVGRYVVDRPLGRGGMGEVYLAHSPAGDPVAVKLLRADNLDPVTRERFETEADIARTVVGTNRVARFLDADPYADRPWLAMEYVPGSTLAAHAADHGPLPEALVLSLGALVAEGLEAVHGVGLLHRDLKPQNVILGLYGPVVVDFGLGALLGVQRAGEHGMAVGTIRYMPPEQAEVTGAITPAADVYGLGALLVFAATGHPPYEGDAWTSIAERVRDPRSAPDLHALPKGLTVLVSDMLAHQPDRRPTLATVMASCSRRLEELGTTPTQARHELIDRTAVPVIPTPPSVSRPAGSGAPTPAPAEPAQPVPERHRHVAREVADDLRTRYAAAATL
jgi:eukaryotic-like serine/threonine-protein kinase